MPATTDILYDLETTPRLFDLVGMRAALVSKGYSGEGLESRMRVYEFCNTGVWKEPKR